MVADIAKANRSRKRAVVVCIATTAAVATLEILTGWWFQLISVTAEGLHTAADLLDSLVAFVLVVIASRPADREHPYGHGKFDSLAAIIEGIFVGGAAVWAIVKASQILLGLVDAEPRPEPATVAAMIVASAVYIGVSGHVLRLARQTRSPAVYAEAMHLRTHVYITIGLAASLLLSRAGLSYGWEHAGRIDPMVALVLGAYLLSVAYRMIRPALSQLMDTAVPQEELKEITACLDEFRNEFVEVHAVRARRAGTDRHVDIHLMVPAETTVQEAHRLSHQIEGRLVERHPGTRLLVHIEPALGSALRAYEQRDRVGLVVAGPPSPAEREATHHEDHRAHET